MPVFLELSIEAADKMNVNLVDGNGDVAGRISVEVGAPGSGGVDIRVERVDEAETGPVTVVVA